MTSPDKTTETNGPALSSEELREEQASELPVREEMSVISSHIGGPPVILPIDPDPATDS